MFSLTARTSLKAAAARSLARPAPIAVRFIGGHGSTMHDNDPETLEREKQKNLSGTQDKSLLDNAPGWNDKLASASEAVIKADRSDHSTEDLQAATVQAVHERHHADGAEVSHVETTTTVNPDGTSTSTTVEDSVKKP